jgi:hypothetical protein
MNCVLLPAYTRKVITMKLGLPIWRQKIYLVQMTILRVEAHRMCSLFLMLNNLNKKYYTKFSFNLEHLKQLFRLIIMHKQYKLWVVTPHTLIDGCQCFGGICYFHLMGHSVTTQRTNTNIFTAVRMPDLAQNSKPLKTK